MDLQALIEPYDKMTCVIRAEKKTGGCGKVRIVAVNEVFRRIMGIKDDKITEDSPYMDYIPEDLNFIQLCYQSAVLKKQVHSYQKDEKWGCWMDIIMLPINVDDPGHGYCICTYEISQEPEAEKMAEVSLENVGDVLGAAIKLRGSWDFQSSMDSVVKDIRDMCDARRCCIILTDEKNRCCRVLSEYANEKHDRGGTGYLITGNFYDIIETWQDTLNGNSCLVVSSPNDWEMLKKRNPVWYKSLIEAEMKSIILFSLMSKGEVLGYMWASNFDTNKTLRIMETLKLTTFFVASEIANHMLLEKLETMSVTDVLTGLYNRNAMNMRVARFPEDQDFGIVFADVNGLKAVNDTRGHSAGDELLRSAAGILREIFTGYEIYRMGGDEFMVIVTDTDRKQFDKLVDRFRLKASDDSNVSFAIGSCYDDRSHDLSSALHRADELMYKDKERHYSNT